jgi:hypothetical protein
MALWQTNMTLVPSSLLLQHGVRLGATITDADLELETWDKSYPPESVIERLAERLPKGKSWSENLAVWGDLDGSCVTILREGGVCVEVNARFDLRTVSREIAAAVLDFARELGCWFVTEDRRVIAAEFSDLSAAIRTSKAYTFLENPNAFLDELGRSQRPQ